MLESELDGAKELVDEFAAKLQHTQGGSGQGDRSGPKRKTIWSLDDLMRAARRYQRSGVADLESRRESGWLWESVHQGLAKEAARHGVLYLALRIFIDIY